MSGAAQLPVILLVSGSDLIYKSISRLLEKKFSLLHTENAEQAWNVLIQTNTVAMVMSELAIATDKDALLLRIRNARQLSIGSLPVLLLVSEADSESLLNKALDSGATDYIDLPFSSNELKVRVRLHTRTFQQLEDETHYKLEEDKPGQSPGGLVPQKYFISRLEQELSFSIRHHLYIGSALIKIDGMQKIEQIFGEKALKGINNVVAKIISQQIRSEDAFTYMGKNTFMILYPVTSGMSAQVAVKRIIAKIASASFKSENKQIPITVSVGLYSTRPEENLVASRIMETLARRLKDAESKGGNKIVSSKAGAEQEIVSLEQGLKYIRTQQADKIVRQLPHLLESVYPLLEFAKLQNDASLDELLGKLRS